MGALMNEWIDLSIDMDPVAMKPSSFSKIQLKFAVQFVMSEKDTEYYSLARKPKNQVGCEKKSGCKSDSY